MPEKASELIAIDYLCDKCKNGNLYCVKSFKDNKHIHMCPKCFTQKTLSKRYPRLEYKVKNGSF